LQEGRLFLLETPLDTTGFSRGAWFYLALGGEPPTACWVANAPKSVGNTVEPGGPVGGSVWRYDTTSRRVHVKLWESVDSYYEVAGVLDGDSLVGRGRSYEANNGGWQSDDAVVGRRVGVADPAPCRAAADTAWARAKAALDTMSSLRR
jgi:hypothetical protein